MRRFLLDIVMVGIVTAALLLMAPGHPLAVMAAVILAWVVGQLICAYAFMKALYNGDIVEYRTEPRSYGLASRSTANWRARSFMASYLRVVKAGQSGE